MTINATPGAERGCGSRAPGGVYVECGVDAGGIDISHFMPDPVPAFSMESHRGQDFRKRNGVWHLFDWVGAKHYPTAADVFEETRRFGASRRAAPNDEFGKLSVESRLILVHPRARAVNPARLHWIEAELGLQSLPSYRKRCMLYRATGGEDESHFGEGRPSGQGTYEPCTRFWWLDAGWGSKVPGEYPGEAPEEERSEVPRTPEGTELPHWTEKEESSGGTLRQKGVRQVGETEFRTFGGPKEDSPTGPMDLKFEPGICFSLPITAISVITSADGSHRERSQEIMGKCQIPVTIQDS